MEPIWRRLCSGPQRLSTWHETCRTCSQEPPPGLGLGPLPRQETPLRGLVCRRAPAARTTLGTSGSGLLLGREGRGSEATARRGTVTRLVGSHMYLEAEFSLGQLGATSWPAE